MKNLLCNILLSKGSTPTVICNTTDKRLYGPCGHKEINQINDLYFNSFFVFLSEFKKFTYKTVNL